MISVNRLPLVFRGASKAVIARLRIHVDEAEMYVSYSLVNLSKSRTQKGNIKLNMLRGIAYLVFVFMNC